MLGSRTINQYGVVVLLSRFRRRSAAMSLAAHQRSALQSGEDREAARKLAGAQGAVRVLVGDDEVMGRDHGELPVDEFRGRAHRCPSGRGRARCPRGPPPCIRAQPSGPADEVGDPCERFDRSGNSCQDDAEVRRSSRWYRTMATARHRDRPELPRGAGEGRGLGPAVAAGGGALAAGVRARRRRRHAPSVHGGDEPGAGRGPDRHLALPVPLPRGGPPPARPARDPAGYGARRDRRRRARRRPICRCSRAASRWAGA